MMNLTLQTSVDCNRTDNMMVPNEEKVGDELCIGI